MKATSAAGLSVFLLASGLSSDSIAGRGELAVAGGLVRYYPTPPKKPGPGLLVFEPAFWTPEVLPNFAVKYPNGAIHMMNDLRDSMLAGYQARGISPEQLEQHILKEGRYKSLDEALLETHRTAFTNRWKDEWRKIYYGAPPILVKEIDRTVSTLVLAGPFDQIPNFQHEWLRIKSMQERLATGGVSQAELALVLCCETGFAKRFNEITGIETVGIAVPGSQIFLTHGNSRLQDWFYNNMRQDVRNSIIVLFKKIGVSPDEALILHKQIIIGKVRSYKREPLPLEAQMTMIRASIKTKDGSELAQPTFGYPLP